MSSRLVRVRAVIIPNKDRSDRKGDSANTSIFTPSRNRGGKILALVVTGRENVNGRAIFAAARRRPMYRRTATHPAPSPTSTTAGGALGASYFSFTHSPDAILSLKHLVQTRSLCLMPRNSIARVGPTSGAKQWDPFNEHLQRMALPISLTRTWLFAAISTPKAPPLR